MKIHHLDCGTMCPLAATWVGLDRTFVCHCLLVESPQGLVLVDSGYSLADLAAAPQRLGWLYCAVARIKRDPAITAVRQVQALGYSPQDVRHIVLTHLDFDHAGGIADFPHAKVHVFQPEFEAATHPRTLIDRSRYIPLQWSHGPIWALHQVAGERWFDFEIVRPLSDACPDILLVPLVGHTLGHCGIAVRDGAGWLLHAGDALMHRWEIDPRRGRAPLALRMFQWLLQKDARKLRENRERLQALAKQPDANVRIICAHDAKQMP